MTDHLESAAPDLPSPTDPDARRLALLHEDRRHYRGAFSPPIYRASTFNQPSLAQLQSPEAGIPPNFVYGRVNNPTTRVFEEMMASVEHGEDAVAFASGMGAITACLLTFLQHGDHVLIVEHAYHPAHAFLEALTERMALTVDTFKPGADLEALMRPNTRLIYVESPTSLHFEMLDLRAISRVARAHGAITITDNTWATPIYQQPLDLGIDISLHSVTKYIGGHSDIVSGVAITSHALMKQLRPMAIALGATPSAEDMFLAIRGLRTLSVRMAQHMQTGLMVASWLQKQPLVASVQHPGLSTSPDHALWQSQMSGCSALFGVTLRAAGEGAAEAFAQGLHLFGIAPSWGGYESLLVPVSVKAGEPATFRLSIGLEPLEAILADLTQALAQYGTFISDSRTPISVSL